MSALAALDLIVTTCAVCHTRYTQEQWDHLELATTTTAPDGVTELGGEFYTWRHCPCRNTMALVRGES